MERVELKIYHDVALPSPHSELRAVVNKWKFQDAMMGEQFITFTITSETPIDWSVGDYCQFRGETYTLNYVPSVTQKARTRERQDAYTYENVKFESFQEELTRCIMLDITPTTGDYVAALGTNYTGSSKFQLFCGETSANGSTLTAVCALAAKMQANLDRMFSRNRWKIFVDTTTTYLNSAGNAVLVTHTEDKVLSFDNTTVGKALEEVHNTFDLDYCIRGRNIYIGYNLKNLTSDNADETFVFGYGKGYVTREDQNKALFQIKRIANSQQKIVTRLRALGSTKNMPYRYYNSKYNLSQSLFPTNLQLPDTFETPEVKAANNALRDSTLRAVKGDTNDAYIDKNDDAEHCTEGIREDSARWDGTNGDLPEIYPTIEEATYGELRNALVQDQDGNTGQGSFPNYGDNERIDKLLAIGCKDGNTLFDDANKGNGILPESGMSSRGIPRSANIGMTYLTYNTRDRGDFTNRGNVYAGPEKTLFTIQGVSAGRYAMAPTIGAVLYGFSISCYRDGVSADVGYIITIKQKNLQTGETTTIATYTSEYQSISRGDGVLEMELPEIPDVKNGANAKVSEVRVTELSDITVTFTPVMRNVIVPSGFTDNFSLAYMVGNSRLDNTVTYDPEYNWISIDDSDSLTDTFHVFIQDMGFDLQACWTDETPVIAMKSGRCVGREFEIGENIEKVTHNGKKGYMLTLKRATDNTLNTYYPSATDPIAAGDYFVLLNISMPDVYVKMAEIRLLRAATEYLADNCETQFTYQPSIDDIYLQRNYDNLVKAGRPQDSIFWRLYAGLKFTFRGIPSSEDSPAPLADITIEQVSIQMGESLTPKVELKLNDDVQQSTIQKLTTSVDRIYNGSIFNSGSGGSGSPGAMAAAVLSILQSEGDKLFLSKKHDDVADGKITFNDVVTHNETLKAKKGLKVGNFNSKLLGSGAVIDEEGNAEFESIYSRNFISTPEFRFNRVNVTDGEQWCTNGYGTIKNVEIIDDTTGYITLKLEENDWASVAEGDICRGIYNDVAGDYETADLDDDTELYAAPSEADTEGFGFSSKRGFFTSYFWVTCLDPNTDVKCYSRKGECCFKYQLRHAGVPHPCAFMKFAQYGSFTRADRRSSSYSTSIGHYYEMVLDGVQTWKIQSANIVYRKGYLGDMTVEVKVKDANGNYTGETRSVELRGYGLYVQDNVYFGNAVIQLDPVTLEELTEQLKFYDVSLTEYIDVITVDDVGNCIGGLYTESGNNNEYRTYRIQTTLLVRKNGVLLILAEDDEDAGKGTYKINVQNHGCTTMIQGSTIYITGISHIKDGVAGSGDDASFDYEAMRQMSHCSVDIIVDCEGKGVITKTLPVSIKHDSQPFVGADITNEFSAVSWNTRTQQYVGLPIAFDMKMWKNNEPLDVMGVNVVCQTLDPDTQQPVIPAQNISASIVTVNGTKQARIAIRALPEGLPPVAELAVTTSATYAGVSYERTLIHTINKSTDTNVYSLLPSVSEIIINKNEGTLSEDALTCAVVCDSSDNKHYNVPYADFAKHKVALYYRKFYHDGTSDAEETPYDNTAITVNSAMAEVRFFLYGRNGDNVDRSVLHDQESVPIIAEGLDGKGVEYIFFQQNAETPIPTIDDEEANRQVDNYCPYNTQGTQQWTDEPVGVGANSRFEFYAQRKKVNGVWQPFGNVLLWNRYTTDGTSPYIIDLSNEQSFINCDQNGEVTGSYESSRLMLFKGTAYAFTDFNIKITPVGIRCNEKTSEFSLSDSDKTTAQTQGYYELTPSVITTPSAHINIEATLRTNTSIKLVAVYKINKNYAGGEGKDAVYYSLIPTLNVIHKNKNGTFRDTYLSVQVNKVEGKNVTVLDTYDKLNAEGLKLTYQGSHSSEQTTSSITSLSTSTLCGQASWTKLFLRKSSDNTLLDSERINVVQDGQDGQDGVDGDDGVVFKLLPSTTMISFARGSDGRTLTPSSVQLSCGYVKSEGKTLTPYSGTVVDNLWIGGGAPYSIMYRFKSSDGSYNPVNGYQWSKDLEEDGCLLTIPNNTDYIAIEFILTSAYSSYHYDENEHPGGVKADNIIDMVTVGIKKDGEKGGTGPAGEGIFVNDCGIYTPGTMYSYESNGDVWVRDMVRYEIGGIMYGFLVKTKGLSISDAPSSASGDDYWEAAGIVNTVIANTIFGTNANIGGFMASANRLGTSQTAYRVIYRGSYADVTTKAVYRGTWQSGTTYYGSAYDSSEGISYKDVVYYGGSYYIPVNGGAVSNTSTPPPANSTEWQLISTSSWEYAAVGNEKAYYPNAPYVFSDDIDVPRRHMVLYEGSYYVVKRIGTKIFSSLPTNDVWRLANSEEIAAVNSELKENNEPYVDIPVFMLNGVEGTMRMRQKDDTVWSVDNSGKNVLGEEAGQRVEISPTSKEISIFNESGALSATFDGTTVVSMDSMFGNTSGNVEGTENSIYRYGNGSAGRIEKGIQIISSDFTVNGPASAKLSYNIRSTGDLFTSGNATGDGATNGPMPSPSMVSGSGEYLYRNYAIARLSIVKSNGNGGYTEVKMLEYVMAEGTTLHKSKSNESVSISTAGTYYLAILYTFGVYANRDYRAYIAWSNISLSFATDIYLARVFANGFSYGSSANNFVAAVNEGGNTIRFKCVTNNGMTGIEVSSDGIKAMSNGIWGKIIPTILFVKVVYNSSATNSLTAYTLYSAAGGEVAVAKVRGGREGEGQIEVTFPSGFSSYGLSLDNTMPVITPYGGDSVNGHMVSFNSRKIIAEFNRDDTNIMCSFLLELKYFG